MDSGLATSGTDFQPFSQLLIFEDGETQLLHTVATIDDSVPEGPEDFLVTLSVPSGDTLVDASAVSFGSTVLFLISAVLLSGHSACCD